MTLLEIRKKFIELSGRYDLVSNTSTWLDNGANFFINSGQNFLDRLVETPETKASVFLPLAVGTYSVMFQLRCRAILEVWANNTTTRVLLEKCTLKEMKEYYDGLVSEITAGVPLYYCPANLRALETTVKTSLGTFLNYTHTESDKKYNYRGLIIAPVVDESYVIEVIGNFYQNSLSDDTQENYWTLETPELLLKAALYQLEVFYRNSEGAKDWLNALQFEIAELDKDMIEELICDIDDMKG